MKTYRVILAPRALVEGVAAAKYIEQQGAPLNAARWYEGLEKAIQGLALMPNRCAVAPETQFLGMELRHYIYKSHRVIFSVDEEARIVHVLHVRHGAMLPTGMEPPPDDAGDETAAK